MQAISSSTSSERIAASVRCATPPGAMTTQSGGPSMDTLATPPETATENGGSTTPIGRV